MCVYTEGPCLGRYVEGFAQTTHSKRRTDISELGKNNGGTAPVSRVMVAVVVVVVAGLLLRNLN